MFALSQKLTDTTRTDLAESVPEDAVIELFAVLRGVDLYSPLAKLNETTIADNNGGRIIL